MWLDNLPVLEFETILDPDELAVHGE